MPEIFASLIQGDFGASDHRNFEAVIKVGRDLWHFWRNNSHERPPWQLSQHVCRGNVAHAGAIIQSTLGTGEHGNFEVVVPLFGPDGKTELWHFFHDNSDVRLGWERTLRITGPGDHVLWPATIIQSHIGGANNFEVVVPLLGPNGNPELWHFVHENNGAGTGWTKKARITRPGDIVAGPGSILQASRGPDNNDFQVVVPIQGLNGRPELCHYIRNNRNPDAGWEKIHTVTGRGDWVAGGGVILESDFRDRDNRGNLEVVVPILMPHGHIEVRHFWHDTDPITLWKPGALITAAATGRSDDGEPKLTGVSFALSDYGLKENGHRNFEVLVEECRRSVVHYFRDHELPTNPWLRTSHIFDAPPPLGAPILPPILTGEEPVFRLEKPRKICQLTGEFDLEGWDKAFLGDTSDRCPALASHDDRLFFAWKGVGNDKLNLMFSDEGVIFVGKRITGETSDRAPALTSHDGRLCVAWKGSGNEQLNVAKVLVGTTGGGFGIEGLEDKVVLGETSDEGPALATHGGRLFLAWKGAGNDALNLMFSEDNGATFRGKATFSDESDHAPALASHNGRLFLAWKGSGNEHLNVAKVNLVGNTAGGLRIEGLEGKVTLGDTTEQSPALASHNGRLMLAWKGSGNDELNLMFSEDNGSRFEGKPRVPDNGTLIPPPPTEPSVDHASCLAAHRGRLFWAWKNDHRLSVVRISPPALTGNRTVFAQNRTETRAGANIRGADLGTAFLHNDPQRPDERRICFLFGDTWRVNQSEEHTNFDSIAFSRDFNPDDGLDLRFNIHPPVIRDAEVEQAEFDVPLDGVSFRGTMFVFFSTGHFKAGQVNQMGRSIVARSDNDGLDFSFLRDFSSDKFVNVSLEVTTGAQVGLPTFGTTLLIWGTGRFRSSDVYLAAMPLEEIASGRFVRFYAGQANERPIWGNDEGLAVPLFAEGCVGELSVRFDPFVARWIILYMSDNPGGILMRSAEQPWGPWTEPVMVFDKFAHGGSGRFLHMGWDFPGNPHDLVHDHIISDEGDPLRLNAWGEPYGPGIIAPLTRGTPGVRSDMFFTMSTWNPYQTVLMTASLQVGGPELPPIPRAGRAATRTRVAARLEIHGRTPF